MKTAVSLFSGCGGSDAGVLAAGFNVLLANDILPYAKDVYEANHPSTDYILGSVEKIVDFPKANLLVGCYPCQGFSQGGVRDPSRKINTLYLEFARALKAINPRAFIVENVSGMVRANFSHLLTDQLKVFTEAGYKVKYQVLNAADYGVAISGEVKADFASMVKRSRDVADGMSKGIQFLFKKNKIETIPYI